MSFALCVLFDNRFLLTFYLPFTGNNKKAVEEGGLKKIKKSIPTRRPLSQSYIMAVML